MSIESFSQLPLGLLELGRFARASVRVVTANLQAVLGAVVDPLGSMKIPEEALQRHRRQYDAGLIIKHLSRLSFPHHQRILALTAVDLCSPILTYVYGEAELGGRLAVVSDFRLKLNEDGTSVEGDLHHERLVKVALHEVAHTFTLYHCDVPGCLMSFSPNLRHLDALDIAFCRRCEFLLRENLQQAAGARP